MKKLLFLIAALLMLSGCINNYYVTPTPTAGPSPTPEGSPTDAPTSGVITPEPTISVPTATPTLNPTATQMPRLGNLLDCAGFECGDHLQKDQWGNLDGDLRVANGWSVGWSGVPAPYDLGLPHECNGFKAHAEREMHNTHVADGSYSQRLIQAFHACSVWLYQTVEVVPGLRYEASAEVLLWSTGYPVVDTPSTADMAAWICLDPRGGSDPFAVDVVCGPAWWNHEQMDKEQQDIFGTLTAQAVAESHQMTLIVLLIPNYPVGRSDGFVENVSLKYVDDSGGGGPTSGPATPMPTPSFIEVTPPREDALGVMIFKTLTNVRNCESALGGKPGWPNRFDAISSCLVLKLDSGANQVGTPQDGPALIHKWAVDRVGNKWACFDDGCWIVAVACYNAARRGDFYPGVGTWEYFRLLAAGKLPPVENPCVK